MWVITTITLVRHNYLPGREIHVAYHAFVGVESDFHEALHPALRGRRSGEVDGDSVMSS